MNIKLLKKQIDWCHMKFHEHLRQLREVKNLTQADISEQIGIAKTTYIGYEKGNREPRLSELKKMAEVFGISISQLCMETDTTSVEDSLVLQFQAVKRFNAEELKTFKTLVEAMVLKHHANAARSLSDTSK